MLVAVFKPFFLDTCFASRYLGKFGVDSEDNDLISGGNHYEKN